MGMEDHASSPLGMDRPLKGLRVVELASVLAGPLAGSFFAELGAEVIKVENPATGGDVTRQWRSADEPLEGPSAYYVAANGPKVSSSKAAIPGLTFLSTVASYLAPSLLPPQTNSAPFLMD